MGNKNQERKMTDNEIYELYVMHKDNTFDWQTLTDVFNQKMGTNYTKSAIRLQVQYGQRWEEALTKKNISHDIHDLYALKERRLIEKRKQTLATTQHLNRVVKQYNAMVDLEETIKELVKPLETKSIEKIKFPKQNKSTVFMISDMQENGDGWSDIVFRRVFQKIYEECTQDNIKEIYLIELGDGIDGVLRTSALYENSKGYVGQMRIYTNALAREMNWLAEQGISIKFSIVNSNHTEIRSFGASRGAIKSEDVTILVLEMLKGLLQNNKNIEWLNKEYKDGKDLNHNIIEIQGFKFFTHHADLSGSNPNNADGFYNKILKYHGRDIDFVLGAHYHNFNARTISKLKGTHANAMVIYNGALDPRQSKSNEYALMVCSTPSFTRLDVQKNNGISLIKEIKTEYEID